MAEFDNARKRAAREREELIRDANESLIRELLPVLDNFERALQAARATPPRPPSPPESSSSSASSSACSRSSVSPRSTSVGSPFDPSATRPWPACPQPANRR